MKNKEKRLNLALFDGEGGTASAGAPTGNTVVSGEAESTPSVAGRGKRANPLADVVYGKQAGETAPAAFKEEGSRDAAGTQTQAPPVKKADKAPNTALDRQAEFERIIEGEYKDLFDQRMHDIIDKRFKETKQLEKRITQAEPIFEMLGKKYGVDGKDLKKLVSAIEEDDSYYEEEALKRGLSVEQLKSMKKLERDNEAMRRALEDQQRREKAQQVYSEWVRQAEELKAVYPQFDLQKECADERFIGLLQNHIDVRTAYEVIHRDEILGGAMQYTAQQVSQKIVDGIRSKGARPVENGVQAGSAATVKADVNAWSKADRDEVERRVLRGEKIIL